jgi:MOSC domain-containing protein YiiM
MNSVGRLLSRHLHDLPPGKLTWIGLRPERKQDMIIVEQTRAIADLGLEGDRRCLGTPGTARQITLINQEHIDVVASLLGLESINPALLRRNLVVSGINLLALRHQKFRIGKAEFEATAQCHPCLRMEQALGNGAVGAMLGHGGICAKVITSGHISLNDQVEKI